VGLNVGSKGYVYHLHTYGPLDREWLYYNFAAESFHTEYSVAEFIRQKSLFVQKMTNSLFEPPLGGLRGKVHISSVAHWKARGRLLICDN